MSEATRLCRGQGYFSKKQEVLQELLQDRTEHSAVNKLVVANRSHLPKEQLSYKSSVINTNFLQLHQPLWCISSRRRTSESRASLAKMHLQ